MMYIAPSQARRCRASGAAALPAVCALCAALGAAPARGAGAQEGGTGTVRGSVVSGDADAPVRASIAVLGGAHATSSDDEGHFTLRALPVGPLTLRVRALGHRPLEHRVVVSPAGEVTTRLRLEPLPLRLTAVRVAGARPERERFELSPDVGAVSLGGRALGQLPAVGEADVLRAVQLLPGVVARSDFSAGYNVRGGEADQNLVLLDGAPVYNPFHLGGLFGTFIDEGVRSVDLLTGGFPAPYGGRLSSVLEVTSAEATRPGVHGSAEVSLVATSAAAGGATEDARGTWNLAVRRTYADALAGALSGTAFPYHFRDAHYHVSYLVPTGGTLALTAYGALDELRSDERSRVGEELLTFVNYELEWGNQVLSASLTQPLGERATLLQRASYSAFHARFDVEEGREILLRDRIAEYRLAGTLSTQRGAHGLSSGYELSHYRTSFRERSGAGPFDALAYVDLDTTTVPLAHARLRVRQRLTALSLFAEDLWRAADGLLVRGGLRAEAAPGARWLGVSPRLSLKYFLTPDVAVTAGGGRYAQWVHAVRNEDAPLQLFDVWLVSDEGLPVSTGWHGVAGAEAWLSSTRVLRAEGYWKAYRRLSEPRSTWLPRPSAEQFRHFDGSSYGLDLYLQQLAVGPVSGWLSYGYGVSARERDGRRYWAAQDRRHNLNAVVSYVPAPRLALRTRFALASGSPYTAKAGELARLTYDGAQELWEPVGGFHRVDGVWGERNRERYPAYHRLDVSAERGFPWKERTVRAYLHVVNVYNRRNVFRYQFDATEELPTADGEQRPRAVSQFPLLPTVGVRVEW